MSDTAKRLDRAEISKRVERAEKLLQKGKTAEALEEYLQVLAADPANDTFRQMTADLCLSLQRIPQAVKLMGELFERQAEAGDATRASLTYKKLARYVNPTWEQKVRFGELLENSNRKLALETYENAFDELGKQNRKAEALQVLEKILALDPGEKNLQRRGELCSELGDQKAAATTFMKIANAAAASGKDATQWIERAYTEYASDIPIALAYAKSLLGQEQVGAAIFVLEPHAKEASAQSEFNEVYVRALMAANRLAEAEPILWKLFEENPSHIQEIAKLIDLFIDSEQEPEAVALARKLDQYQRRKGERKSFVAMMQEIVARHRPSSELLEFMSELFNGSNREAEYCQTLINLFDLQYGLGNYLKAAEALDRAAEVDAYETGHQKRLESLRGKIDENRFQVIASRFTSLASANGPVRSNEEKTLGAGTLQDLMLQAEILVQYGMRTKAIERLQRIQELFPHEEDRNQTLQQLYLTAGMIPQYSQAASVPSPQVAAALQAAVPALPTIAEIEEAAEVSSFTRVSEITRKLYRQGNSDAVLLTAANEIGAQWNVERCVAAMRKPGLTLTALKEFCATAAPGGQASLEKVAATVQDLAISRGTLSIPDVQKSPELKPIQEALANLNIRALMAIPLSDGSDHVGVLFLGNSTPRSWNPNDIMVLKTISEQIVIALNNAGLRRLVKNLSVTDEKSGLLKRASYLDLLMAETKRAVKSSTPVTVLLMRCGERSAMLKEFGEAAIEAAMQRIGQLFAANVRQNDLAFRYDTTSIAMVLGETSEKEALMAVDKLKKILVEIYVSESKVPIPFAAGVAEAVIRQEYDAVDIVTEVINRAEQALDVAVHDPSGIVVQSPAIAAAAVA
ncbi:MAG TPA: GAF domain-containing protein [Terriglobales bacterium]|nr:GAF domain-containing protein [Terriglobales bacterium]